MSHKRGRKRHRHVSPAGRSQVLRTQPHKPYTRRHFTTSRAWKDLRMRLYFSSHAPLLTCTPLQAMSFSRRSPVLCRHGCVACNQPLAAEAGVSVLKRGGNAADAAVAVAAALQVTQPCSTGLGGDCFCLFYDAASRSVRGINGRCVHYR